MTPTYFTIIPLQVTHTLKTIEETDDKRVYQVLYKDSIIGRITFKVNEENYSIRVEGKAGDRYFDLYNDTPAVTIPEGYNRNYFINECFARFTNKLEMLIGILRDFNGESNIPGSLEDLEEILDNLKNLNIEVAKNTDLLFRIIKLRFHQIVTSLTVKCIMNPPEPDLLPQHHNVDTLFTLGRELLVYVKPGDMDARLTELISEFTERYNEVYSEY